jgi:hypothetical protein
MTDSATADGRPPDPEVDDTWVSEDGELHTWDGKEWVPFADIPDFGLGVASPFPFRPDKQ